MSKPKHKIATPALSVYISDANWPNMELLIVSDTGREYTSVAMYDIAHSQFQAQVNNAFRENLQAVIEEGKRLEKK